MEKTRVYKLYSLAKEKVTLNEIIIKRAYELQNFGLKAFDALHVASAEYAKADVFLTTDKNLLKITKSLKLDVKTVNPVNWFMEVFDNE